jgi:hypothetical protein
MVEELVSVESPRVTADLLILKASISFIVGTSLRSWEAGAQITDPADIALLADQPGDRYTEMPRPRGPQGAAIEGSIV